MKKNNINSMDRMEAIIMDFYLDKGFKKDGTWGFLIETKSLWKKKELTITIKGIEEYDIKKAIIGETWENVFKDLENFIKAKEINIGNIGILNKEFSEMFKGKTPLKQVNNEIMKIKTMNLVDGYYVDENGNKWDSRRYSLEEAKDSSPTLINCKNRLNEKFGLLKHS